MELVTPSKLHKESYLEAISEFNAENRVVYSELLKKYSGFDGLLRYYYDLKLGNNLPDGFVPASELWLVEGDKFLGQLSLRHELNEFLGTFGGHIGYAIRPSERQKGYGSKILELGLVEAKKLGLNDIFITCKKENIASRKIIEKNGGVLEDERSDKDGMIFLRFWINI